MSVETTNIRGTWLVLLVVGAVGASCVGDQPQWGCLRDGRIHQSIPFGSYCPRRVEGNESTKNVTGSAR